jgi:hypothetical protein
MAAYRFNFDEFLSDALLSLLYGHMYFEQVAYLDGDAIRMRKLAPRHPRTIGSFVLDPSGDGGLVGIRQNIARWENIGGNACSSRRRSFPSSAWSRSSGAGRPARGSGAPCCASIYREWMVKDRTIRIAAVNLERAGGMPVIEGPQGASDPQLRDLARWPASSRSRRAAAARSRSARSCISSAATPRPRRTSSATATRRWPASGR